jgi:hypothetical protein
MEWFVNRSGVSKWVVLLSAVSMIGGLVGCSGPDPIVGKWRPVEKRMPLFWFEDSDHTITFTQDGRLTFKKEERWATKPSDDKPGTATWSKNGSELTIRIDKEFEKNFQEPIERWIVGFSDDKNTMTITTTQGTRAELMRVPDGS